MDKLAIVASDFPIVVKVWHVVAGLYIWEFLTTLDYEWSVIRGFRPYRWTIWIYSIMRVATLMVVIIPILDFNFKITHGCHVLIAFHCIFTFTALSTAELLIVLRIIAVWNRHKVVMAIAILIWVTNLIFFIQTVVRLRSSFIPVRDSCLTINFPGSKIGFVATLTTDFVLLIIMLVGLIRLRLRGYGMMSLGRTLWKQGIIWLLIAAIADIPPVVCMNLNLNEGLIVMFLIPMAVTLSIAATRMHLSLVHFIYGSSEIAPNSLQGCGTPVSRVTATPPAQTSLNQTEVVVHRECFQLSTFETSHDGSYTGEDGKGRPGPKDLV